MWMNSGIRNIYKKCNNGEIHSWTVRDINQISSVKRVETG
jgi:hypothetical protein